MIRALAVLALVPLAAACNTARPPRGEEGAPKAVVLCGEGAKERAETIARALNSSLDYDVLLKVTTIRRAKSSVAIYGLRDRPERLDELTELLHDLAIGAGTGPGEIELLPFQQHATGGNALVFWLGDGEAQPAAADGGTSGSPDQSRDASSPATSR